MACRQHSSVNLTFCCFSISFFVAILLLSFCLFVCALVLFYLIWQTSFKVYYNFAISLYNLAVFPKKLCVIRAVPNFFSYLWKPITPEWYFCHQSTERETPKQTTSQPLGCFWSKAGRLPLPNRGCGSQPSSPLWPGIHKVTAQYCPGINVADYLIRRWGFIMCQE